LKVHQYHVKGNGAHLELIKTCQSTTGMGHFMSHFGQLHLQDLGIQWIVLCDESSQLDLVGW
jgi:hypothetical protein